jgi:hypothetical protein
MADGHRAVWLSIAGHFAQGMARAQGARCEIHLTTLLEEAIAGTQYVSTQLRGGGMEARRGAFLANCTPSVPVMQVLSQYAPDLSTAGVCRCWSSSA